MPLLGDREETDIQRDGASRHIRVDAMLNGTQKSSTWNKKGSYLKQKGFSYGDNQITFFSKSVDNILPTVVTAPSSLP
jgi:hypothetical protein